QAEQRPITVGEWQGDGWFITAGLAAGEQVVVDGGLRLTQGATAKVSAYVPPKSAARPAAATESGTPKPATGAPTRSAAVYFARGDSTLDAEAVKTVREAAAAMMGIGTVVTLTGYADRTGTARANVD